MLDQYALAQKKYHRFGTLFGYHHADIVLMDHLPADNPAGLITDVEPNNIIGLIDALDTPPKEWMAA